MQRRGFEMWNEVSNWGAQPSPPQTQEQVQDTQNSTALTGMMQCQGLGESMTQGSRLQMSSGVGVPTWSTQAVDTRQYVDANPSVLSTSFTTLQKLQLDLPGSHVNQAGFGAAVQSGLGLQSNAPLIPTTNIQFPNETFSWASMGSQFQPTSATSVGSQFQPSSTSAQTFQSPVTSQLFAGATGLGT
eukprot:1603979-Rhodomonas_salina.1